MFLTPSLSIFTIFLSIVSEVCAATGQQSAASSAPIRGVHSPATGKFALVSAFDGLKDLSFYPGLKDGNLLLAFEERIVSSLGAMSTTLSEESERELSAPSFTCQSMNETFNPLFMCSDVVDYPYYLPQGSTLDDLEDTVRGTVPSSFGLMTGMCLSDYKKMMCSRVFLKCVDGVIPDDTSTYVDSLPYQKPCKSLCESASYLGSTCGGFLEAIGVDMTCSDNATYSQEADSSGSCNYLASHTGVQVVSDRVETYNGTLCAGIADQVYMSDPNTTTAVPGLPPLLPPGEHQKILESTMETLNTIPRWLKTDCMTSMRKAFCGATFLEPAAKTDLIPYGFGTVYMPRFPDYSICTDYRRKCADPLAEIFSDVSVLHLDCNMTALDTQGQVRVFPDSSQVVAAVPMSPSLTIYMATEPSNTSASTSFAVESQCPYGFEDIFHSPRVEQPYTINMLSTTSPTSTNCVYQCPVKMYVEEDYDMLNVVKKTELLLSIIPIGLAVANLVVYWYKTGAPLKTLFVFPALLVFLNHFPLLVLIFSKPEQTRILCASDTTWYRLDTVGAGWVDSGALSCAIEGFLNKLINMCLCDVMAMITIELHLRAVQKYSNSAIASIKPYIRTFSICYHGIPTLLHFCFSGHFLSNEESQAYSGLTDMFSNRYICSYTSGNMLIDMVLSFIPVMLSYLFSTIVSTYTLAHCIIISYRAMRLQSDNPLLAIWKSYKFLIITNAAFVIFFTYFLCLEFLYNSKGASINFIENFTNLKESIEAYYTCIISEFTSLEDDPSGGQTRCSIAEINRWRPASGDVSMEIVLIFLRFWHPISTWNSEAANFYWHVLPIPLKSAITKISSSMKGIKVLPITDAVEKAGPDDMEEANLKLKSKGGHNLEETKDVEIS